MEINSPKENKNGVVIAQIIEKIQKRKKDGKPFWILKLSIRRSLTEMYFKLVGKKEFTLKSSEEPLYVFTERGRFVNTLLERTDYFFEFKKTSHDNKDYLHIEDWNKLGDDKKLIERAWRLILNRGEEIKEESEKIELTNQQLLEELEKRIENKEILIETDKEKFPIPNSIMSVEREFVTDLRDSKGKKKIDLQGETNLKKLAEELEKSRMIK